MYTTISASILFLVAMGTAVAQESAPVAASTQTQGPALPLWELGVFGGGLSTPAYPGSVDRTSRALALPFVIYRGEVFRADRSSVGARMVHSKDYEIDLGFSVALPVNSDDVAVRKGMPDLGTLIEVGPRAKFTLARPKPGSQLVLELPLRMALEVGGGVRDKGVVFEPELTYDIRDIGGGWSLGASAGWMFGDQRLNQHFYGVDAAYATATRARYEAQAGLVATRLGLSSSKALTNDVRISGFVRYETYQGAANLSSPLHLAAHGTSYGMALTWTLGRSALRAKD